ncbi:hypothetical protein PCANC_19810 [Puccinia coronata f. sp. avenae]|uniref:Uncharacterized protein n=1 Tax=Puccinia coronata f. sp. avenae TaxID=200324 RepID=A0A2N5UPS9_9BASI|nr:hypothetical protein PCANC_19810 [Puccinia coronata f. sp. avenae]
MPNNEDTPTTTSVMNCNILEQQNWPANENNRQPSKSKDHVNEAHQTNAVTHNPHLPAVGWSPALVHQTNTDKDLAIEMDSASNHLCNPQPSTWPEN